MTIQYLEQVKLSGIMKGSQKLHRMKEKKGKKVLFIIFPFQ